MQSDSLYLVGKKLYVLLELFADSNLVIRLVCFSRDRTMDSHNGGSREGRIRHPPP